MSEGINVDFLILADSAQVQGNKLHMLGGGWSFIWVKEFPAQHQLAVAAGILIPWMETNTPHNFRVELRAEDGTKFSEMAGEFEQGRPAGLLAGTTQRMMIAANFGIRIERAVEAVAELWLDGVLARTVPFRIAQRAS